MFKELFTESEDRSDIHTGIEKIMKNKGFTGQVVEYGDELYFSIIDTKTAIRLKKRLVDTIMQDTVREFGGGASDYHSKIVFGDDNAKLKIRFDGGVPLEFKKYVTKEVK